MRLVLSTKRILNIHVIVSDTFRKEGRERIYYIIKIILCQNDFTE